MKNYFLRQEGEKVFMCCGKAGCPSVNLNEEGLVEISDDDGNKVKMKKEEAALIQDAIKTLSSKNED